MHGRMKSYVVQQQRAFAYRIQWLLSKGQCLELPLSYSCTTILGNIESVNIVPGGSKFSNTLLAAIIILLEQTRYASGTQFTDLITNQTAEDRCER
jgi:hypothetical protein